VAPYEGMQVFDANSDHPRPQERRAVGTACCCATRPTTTRTRTAGAAATRSSSARSTRGSCGHPRSATGWSS
jgi:hypothetical protein